MAKLEKYISSIWGFSH